MKSITWKKPPEHSGFEAFGKVYGSKTVFRVTSDPSGHRLAVRQKRNFITLGIFKEVAEAKRFAVAWFKLPKDERAKLDLLNFGGWL